MVDTYINWADAGKPSIQSESFGIRELVTGDKQITHTAEVVAAATVAGADLPAFSVVGRDASGEIVMAKTTATAVKPIGITAAAVKQGATNLNVTVLRSGIFNPDALNWHEDYADAEDKRLAFEDSVNGTDIIIRSIQG